MNIRTNTPATIPNTRQLTRATFGTCGEMSRPAGPFRGFTGFVFSGSFPGAMLDLHDFGFLSHAEPEPEMIRQAVHNVCRDRSVCDAIVGQLVLAFRIDHEQRRRLARLYRFRHPEVRVRG